MFQKNLKSLRKSKRISQAALAEELGVRQSTVGMWESGKNKPEYETLLNIASFFDVSMDQLIGSSSAIADTSRRIPVLGSVIAGMPMEAIEDVTGYEEIPSSLAASGDFFALNIVGSSMEPRMQEGDVIIVRKQDDVNSGDVAVVLVDQQDATCKKVVKHDNGISLIAYNSAVYEPHFYTSEEVETLPLQILGKVMELRRKF